MAIKDGRLEVATAIAETTDLVTVDATTTPFSTDPADLFDLRYNDNKVGMDDFQMRSFKDTLDDLLPEIAQDIARIPDNANLVIEDVAEFVMLALSARNALSSMRRGRAAADRSAGRRGRQRGR